MNILVFKTNVSTQQDADLVKAILNTVESINEWNFDLEDCDRILRVVTGRDISAKKVEKLLNDAGILCQELQD